MSLGATLRELRQSRGMTGVQLASRIGMTQGTISKLECGKLVPDLDYLTKFAASLRLTRKQVASLFERAGVVPVGSTPQGLMQYLPTNLLRPDWSERRQATVELAESNASHIRGYETLLVPGLLQTETYARSVLRIAGVRDAKSVERAVRARLRRQQVLKIRDKRFTFVVNESALLAKVGPCSVLAAQIEHLLSLVKAGPVQVGVIPLTAFLPIVPSPSFVLFDARVYIELAHGDIWLQEGGVGPMSYRGLFEKLADAALVGDELIRKLEAILAGL